MGADGLAIRPSATSSAASRPTAFWASLEPWLNASQADISHSPARTGVAQRRVPWRSPRCTARVTARAASAPSTGATASAIAVPMTPTGRRPSSPPHCTAPAPPSMSAAPTRPPTSACPELDGSPSHHVSPFHATAASSPAAITAIAASPWIATMPPIVSATAAPNSSGPSVLNTAASSIAWAGRATRVATSAAIAFEASCTPLVNANASTSRSAIPRPRSIALAPPAPQPAPDLVRAPDDERERHDEQHGVKAERRGAEHVLQRRGRR